MNSNQSHTYSVKVNDIRKDDIILLKGFPCKIIKITISKTGKHGHAKAHITGIDIFTNKKHEDIFPTSHNVDKVNIINTKYFLLNISDDNYLSLLFEENGEQKDDFKLNESNELDMELLSKFKGLNDVDGINVNILSAMGMEKISNYNIESLKN